MLVILYDCDDNDDDDDDDPYYCYYFRLYTIELNCLFAPRG